jgi:acetyl esterase
MQASGGARRARMRQTTLARATAAGFGTLARFGGRTPFAHPARHGVERVADLPYLPDALPEQHLDVYRPLGATGPLPAIVYVHGGGFRALSKETHWLMGLAFARAGYVVFNISYRLAPRHRFPAAWQDTAAAWSWVLENGASWGADLSRLAVAGESAGANLVSALTVMATTRRPEPWARRVFDAGVVPRAALPACGILQVSDTERFGRRRRLPFFIRDVIEDIPVTVLPPEEAAARLADPLLILEQEAPERALPPFFLPVGTRDPILDDTRRMAVAVAQHGAEVDVRYYPGEAHAFHALVWRKQARLCWRDMLAFTERHIGGGVDARP